MKKTYTAITVILATASLLVIASSCNKFLDVASREIVEEQDREDVFTPSDYLTATYGMFNAWPYAFSYLGITEIISDNADKGSSSSDTGSDKDVLDDLTFTTSSGSVREMWSHWYSAIGRASQTITYCDEYEFDDPALKTRIIGEAQFLRALNYFFLVRCWGDIPVQDYDAILTGDMGSLKVRKPVAEVYAYIVADLKDAAKALPLRSQYSSIDLGRATKGAAQALLAKVYLYRQDWNNASLYADSVILSGEYSLITPYIDAFKSDAVYHNSRESIFEFQAKGSDASIAQGVQQYSQTQGARGETGWGWGFNTPSQDLLNAFDAEGDTVRRNATIIFRNSVLYDGRRVGSTENPMYNYKAYSSSAPGDAHNDRFVPYLRLAEIHLIKAEAANEAGDPTTALQELNTVRNRANLPQATATDQTALRQAIWNERRLELAMEHDRWFDLIRTGRAATVMQAHGKNFIAGKHELFPIPNDQLIQTPELGQNPNW